MFRICKIITETIEGANNLKEFLGGYPVEITSSYPDEGYFEVPTLIIGWNSVKSRFTSQKIQDKNVTTNLQWTYSESECKEIKKENFHNNIEYFVNDNLKKWLPSDFFLYDSLMHGDFSKFIEKNIDSTKLTYIHFNSGAIYMRNDNKNFIVNTKSLWFTESDYRSVITDEKVYSWLILNAWKFGFIRTVSSEEWHWEYRPGEYMFSRVKRDDKLWYGLPDKLGVPKSDKDLQK